MRLIDADKVILEIVHKYGREQGDAILEIDNAPVVDAVSIVRCKDCKWKELCQKTLEYKGADGYCSRGERREDADSN